MIHHFLKCAGISLGLVAALIAALALLILICTAIESIHDAIKKKWGDDGLVIGGASVVLAVIWALLFIICWVK